MVEDVEEVGEDESGRENDGNLKVQWSLCGRW